MFLLPLLSESEDFASWRASRRPETFLLSLLSENNDFVLQPSPAKCGLKASKTVMSA